MTDESNLDRRSFLRQASTAGLVGVSGVGGSAARTRSNGDETDRTEAQGGQDGGVEYFRAILPAGDLLEAGLVYKIIVVGLRTRPGERPPPVCFPEVGAQWRARDALVVKPTETTGIFGEDERIGAVERSRAYLERPVAPGTVYRITGGEFCDGHARVTVHELPPELSEYFSTRLLDQLDGNGEGGNGTDGNATGENRGDRNETPWREVLGDSTADGRIPDTGGETR